MKTYVVILAGGQGKRLWPFTTTILPKHLLFLDHTTTLLDAAIIRSRAVLPDAYLCIVTTSAYADAVGLIAQRYQAELFVEPQSRNTAAAVLYAVEQLRLKNDIVSDDMIFVIPADQMISTESYNLYRAALDDAQRFARMHSLLALIGVPQRYPSTRFGFIQCGQVVDDNVYKVTRFHEKPTVQSVARYYGNADILWNTGMLVGTVAIFYNLYKRYAPDFLAAFQADTTIPSLQFDTLILERSQEACIVVRGAFHWEDLGSLETFIPAVRSDPVPLHEVLGAERNLIYTTKKTVVAGVSDLCVIETNDVLVIMKREFALEPERVAQAVQTSE